MSFARQLDGKAPTKNAVGQNRVFSNGTDHYVRQQQNILPDVAGSRSAIIRNRAPWPWNPISERKFAVADVDGFINPQVKKNAGGLIEQFLAVHKDNVTALSGIELSDKPASGRFGNLTGGD